MRKTTKWFLCLALIVAVVCGAMTAFAQEQTYVAENVQTGQQYEDVSAALQAADDGQIVKLLQDTEAKILTVGEETTLDLNGYELTATYASVFGHMIDGSAENTGALKVDDNKLLINTENKQLPVKTDKGYRFVEIVGFNTAWVNDSTFVFQPLFEAAACDMLKNGAAATGVSIQINVTWRPFEGSEDLDSRTFKYGDNLVTQFVNSYNASTGKFGRMFTLTLVNPKNYVDLQCNTKVVSTTRVEFVPAKGSAVLKQEVLLNNEQASAIVAEGTKVQQSGMELILSTTEMETSTVVVGEGETARALDIHVAGIAKDNAVPVIVTVKEMAANGLNEGNIALYHVENNETVEMTRVYTIEEVDEHNEYYYDIATGDVTMAMASFSEVAVVADDVPYWNGKLDTSWYNANVNTDTYELFNADQLAGFGALVDGGNTFQGKTVRLMMDVYLSDGRHQDVVEGATPSQMFNPIGYSYEFKGGQVFKGTFDGNGNTVYNMFMNGWDMEHKSTTGEDYTYSMAGAGLFASVVDATIKNLTIDGAQITMECVDMGLVVGYANGNCTFENIVIKNSTIGNYQRYTGGVIGEVGNGHHVLKNVDVEATTTVSSLWGDFDTPLGGIIGGRWAHTYTDCAGENGHKVSVSMDSCDVAAVINAYNDVTSAYQWYSYRRAGMLIGHSEESKTVNGRTEATATYLETVNCTVQYGAWANYHYCEFNGTTSMNARYPWVRVEAGYSNGAYSNPRYGNPVMQDGTKITTDDHDKYHVDGDGHGELIAFQQLYGGGQGCYGGNSHINNGVEIIGKDGPVKNTTKFASNVNNQYYIVAGNGSATVKLGDLFKATGEVMDSGVFAFVSPTNKTDSVRGSFNIGSAATNWEEKTLTITGSGTAEITITDYYYCNPTTITVDVLSAEPSYLAVANGKNTFAKGDSFATGENFVAIVALADGSTVNVTQKVTFSGFDSSSAGVKIITVSFAGVSTTYNVRVIAPTMLEATANRTLFNVNEKVEKDNFTVRVKDNTGASAELTNFTISNVDTSTAGDKVVTITDPVNGLSTDYTITVMVLEMLEVNMEAEDYDGNYHRMWWFMPNQVNVSGWFYYNELNANGAPTIVRTEAYTGGNQEIVTGFNDSWSAEEYWRNDPDGPQGKEFFNDPARYDLKVEDAIPGTTLGVNCSVGYDAPILGIGYIINGDPTTFSYGLTDGPSGNRFESPEWGPDGFQTLTYMNCYQFEPGENFQITWVAVFEDGLQEISTWDVTMKSDAEEFEVFVDTTKPNANVIVLSGQSNMFGASPITDAVRAEYESVNYSNVYIRYANINFTDNLVDMKTYFSNGTESFDQYQLGIGGQSNTYFGPEAALAKYLATTPEFAGQTWYIVKYAPAGTALNAQWNNKIKVDGVEMTLTEGLLNFVQDAVGDLENQGYDVQIHSFLWMQGESDACNEAFATAYAGAEKNLVKQIRETFAANATRDVSAPHVAGSGIAFINAGIADNDTGSNSANGGPNDWIYASTVNAGKISNSQWLCSLPGVGVGTLTTGPLAGYTFPEGQPTIPNPDQSNVIPNSIFIDTHHLLSKFASGEDYINDGDETDKAHYSAGSMIQLGGLFSSCFHYMTQDNIVPQEFTVTYNANGGECATAFDTYSGTALVLPEATRDGYTLKGWYTAATGGSKVGTATGIYVPTSNCTLYAQWESDVVTYTVTYDANGGTCGTASVDVTEGESTTLPTPTREGYRFDGWSDGNDTYDAGATYTPNATVTLTAQWKKIHNVTVNNSSSKVTYALSSETACEGETITLTLTYSGSWMSSAKITVTKPDGSKETFNLSILNSTGKCTFVMPDEDVTITIS